MGQEFMVSSGEVADASLIGEDDRAGAARIERIGSPKKDIRALLASSAAHADPGARDFSLPAPCGAGPCPEEAPRGGAAPAGGVLEAFGLAVSSLQEVSEAALAEPARGGEAPPPLEVAVLSRPVELAGVEDVVPLLVASAPLLASGRAIWAQLPPQWLDVYGRSDALGTRCLFASRRHEHSVFAPVAPERLLRVPPAAQPFQPAVEARCEMGDTERLAEQEPWAVQVHPQRGLVRVLLRPGALLARMLRRGTALPAARFSWRVLDAAQEPGRAGLGGAAPRRTAELLGEFSILSNVEDAAHTQPPHFLKFPLRREQLRSLHWMVSQEENRHEPFVTELLEAAPCADAPHWRLQGRLQCEYGVKGGVLADAIGYGKTACTIGLIDCTRTEPLPRVPPAYGSFIPTRATLVLAPTNLHAQWLGEIQKFTDTTLRVLSVPTCAQLKRLSLRELMEADVVVATYRLFYSAPYLRRLEELARAQRPGFAFPRQSLAQPSRTSGARRQAATRLTAEWATAYRQAFEALPAWAAHLPRAEVHVPTTPPKASTECTGEVTPAKAPVADAAARRYRGKTASHAAAEEAQGAAAAEAAEAAKAAGAAEAAGATPGAAKRRRLSRKQAAQPGEAEGGNDLPSGTAAAGAEAEEALYVPLEAFWWRRVVCDEFHELLSRYPPAQVAVELFHADYKWGLSGTPPCQSLQQIRKAASFFGVQIPTSEAADAGGEAPRRVAQEWLDAFARRNTAELPPIEEEECIVPVRQTPKERALYLALTGAGAPAPPAPEPGLEEPPELLAARQSASGLLKLCSHFSSCGAAEVLTAADECERQLALRREPVRLAEREARTLAERAAATVDLVRHFEPHFCRAPSRADYGFISREPRAAIAARLRFLGAPTTGTKAELLTRLLGPARADASAEGCAAAAPEDAKEVALRVDFDPSLERQSQEPAKPPPSWAALEAAALGAAGVAKAEPHPAHDFVARALREALAAYGGGKPPQQRCTRLRANLGMPRWSRPDSLAGNDQDFTPEEQTWQWLAEGDNAEKLRKVVDAWKIDVERSAVRLLQVEGELSKRLDSLHSFQETLHTTQVSTVDVEETVGSFAKYGSKIEALVKHVQRLQRDDNSCKVICFVQWEDLKRKISLALDEFHIEHVSLCGSVWARRAALTKFQYEEDGPRLLLLSLEESASGTNLTASNHVIIVHPMEAATREEAVAFEMQAVGRVRRPGQQRKIHIWRFVTLDTIEQRITEEHQRELWERQRARILVEPCGPVAGSELGEDSEEEGEDAEGFVEDPVGAAAANCATQRYMGEDELMSAGGDLATQRYS